MSETTTSPIRILRRREVAKLLGVSLSTLCRLERRSEFPRSLAISPGCRGWRESDVKAWVQARAENAA